VRAVSYSTSASRFAPLCGEFVRRARWLHASSQIRPAAERTRACDIQYRGGHGPRAERGGLVDVTPHGPLIRSNSAV
jgi:hypothetical protein